MMRQLTRSEPRVRGPRSMDMFISLVMPTPVLMDLLTSKDMMRSLDRYVIHRLIEKGLRTHRRARALASVCHCNTFPHRGLRHDGFQNGSLAVVSHDSWTYNSYAKTEVKKQMDFICASRALETRTYVLYGINCGSGHKLLVSSCSIDPAGAGAANSNRACAPQPRSRRRQKSTQGWRPENPSAAAAFKEMMSDFPHGACVQDIQNRFASALLEIPFTNSFQRGPKFRFPKPQELADARLLLAQLTDPSERHRMSRVLYRMKRRWYAAVARERFARSAMSAPPDDAKSSHRVSWVCIKHDEKSYGSSEWGIRSGSTTKIGLLPKGETLDEKRLRLKDLEEKCFLSHSDSSHSWVELPMHTLLDARHSMASNKAPGADTIVHELFFPPPLGGPRRHQARFRATSQLHPRPHGSHPGVARCLREVYP